VAWILLQSALSSEGDGGAVVKSEHLGGSGTIKTETQEDDVMDMDDLDLSDTPRSFPTYGRQAPLRYIPKVKSEDDNEELVSDEVRSHPRAAEADDESEEPIDVGNAFGRGISDSGLGTSFSESGITSAAQRRRSRSGKGLSQ
jgi:seipin